MHPECVIQITSSTLVNCPLTIFDDKELKHVYTAKINMISCGQNLSNCTAEDVIFVQNPEKSSQDYLSYKAATNLTHNECLVIVVNKTNAANDQLLTTYNSSCSLHSLKGSNGTLDFPLMDTSTNTLAGVLQVDYCVIKPWRFPLDTNLKKEATPSNISLKTMKQERNGKSGYLIGHRGCGSDRMSAKRIENTISSFNKACANGADYVELDVMLTKDDIPIVFHDYNAKVFLKQKDSKELPMSLNISQLTLAEWKSAKITFDDGDTDCIPKCLASKDVIESLFPSLKEALELTDPKVGFLIEVKYPMQERTGKWESTYQPDKNAFVDRIIDHVHDYAGDRKVLFCCFDPQICVMLKSKQTKYGVIFNCCLENTLYTPYIDVVSQTYSLAKMFAAHEGLTGLSVLVDSIIDKLPQVVTEMHDSDLVLFTWGDANRIPTTVIKQIDADVDAVVHDNIDEMKLQELK